MPNWVLMTMQRFSLGILSLVTLIPLAVACGGRVESDATGDAAPSPDVLVPPSLPTTPTTPTTPTASPAPYDAGAPSYDAAPEPSPTDAACLPGDHAAHLAAVQASLCAVSMPTLDASKTPGFTKLLVGRWLSCPSPTGLALNGPPESVGIEFTADGKAIYLKLDVCGNIVRGSGPTAYADWSNTWEFLPEYNQLNVQGSAWEQIVHPKVGTSPLRMWLENEGVSESTFVAAPAHI